MPKRFLPLLTVLILLFTGCQAAPVSSNVSVTPTSTALPATSSTAKPMADQPPGSVSDSARPACNRQEQELALRPDFLADWEKLALYTCYQLTIEIQPEVSGYLGTALITYTNLTGQPLQSVVLRTYPNAGVIYGGSLQILEAALDGQVVQPEVFLSDQTAIRLPLQTELQPGDHVQISLSFKGRLPETLQAQPQLYGVFYAAQQPRSLSFANWYPILSEWDAGGWQTAPVSGLGDAVVSAAALYEVQVRAPQGWQIASSGTEIQPGFYTSGPMRDFMLIASPEFQVFEQEEDGLHLRLFSLPGGEERAQEALRATALAMELFAARFGPYPYNELDIVAQPLNLALGVEYPGLFTLEDNLLLSPTDQPWLLSLVAAHEAAHQWWYAVVGNDVIEHPWQDEALATFSSLLYQEAHEPANFRGTLAAYQRTVEQALDEAQDPDFSRSLQSFSDQPELYGPLVYQRGALFYLALRDEIGSSAFYDGLQHYYEEQRFQIAEPQDLLQAFESACSCSLDDFFAVWGLEN